MAYAPTRSMSAELTLGTVEGSYKRINRNRGGFPEDATYRMREDLADIWFGIHESPVKVTPFSRRVSTPDYVLNRPASPEAI